MIPASAGVLPNKARIASVNSTVLQVTAFAIRAAPNVWAVNGEVADETAHQGTEPLCDVNLQRLPFCGLIDGGKIECSHRNKAKKPP